MKCAQCGNELELDNRFMFNKRETFVFKPAHVQDQMGIRAAAISPEELRESRKEHLKTEIATVYATWGKEPVPEGAWNFRHVACGVVRTGSADNLHPAQKHQIRFSRMMPGRLHG